MKDPRAAAAAALMRAEQGGYANLVLNHALKHFSGSARDRAFCAALFYGTVERLITLDFLLRPFLKKPIERLDPEIRAILRCGLYQARWMDSVPVRAAVSESVALTRAMGKTSACGMVNAVLRRAAAVDLAACPWQDDTERLGILYSVSPAIAGLLREAYPADCEEILRASFAPPPLCVHVNTLKTDTAACVKALAASGIGARPGEAPGSLYIEISGDITTQELFQNGAFHVQGEASQFACAALDAKPGETILDLCAAPGGKSASLAQSMQNQGILIARDNAQNRLSLMEHTFARLGITCGRVEHGDAAVYDAALPPADGVLCDVPCSGLGVLAKKPDIRWKTLDTLGALRELQSAILDTAARYVKPSGRLIYSTCTLNPAENEGIVRPFLARHPEFTARRPSHLPAGAEIKEGFAVFLPHRTGTDGFFVAYLTKQ